MRRLSAIALAGLLVACTAAPPPKKPIQSEPTADPAARSREESLEAGMARLQAELARVQEAAASSELRRIDAETRLARLQKRFEELERAHDDAVSEVVRAQAKLRGSVSQADAASDLAEAEIAVNNADTQSGEIAQARSVLEQAAAEFDAGNYGGALYLSTQVKRLVADARSQTSPSADFEPVADETPFESPLALMLNDNSNLREGPGLSNGVITTLPKGTPVDGYSYSGSWVRVLLTDGTSGWIYQTLVQSRDESSNGKAAIE